MKIVHVSTYDIGGAATAALRLHQGLLEQQINSAFLCLEKSNNNQPGKTRFIHNSESNTVVKKIARNLGFPDDSQNTRNHAMIKDLKGEYEVFSFPYTDYRIEEHPLVKNADIVHLHWAANFINYPSFFKTVKQPIVWTLHDMNPFSGGFHYKEDKERNSYVFKQLEEKFLKIKVKAISSIDKLAVVTPSDWLGESARLSNVFKKAIFENIPYGIDLTVFKPHDQSFSRNVFNLPANKKIILFVSSDLNNYRKGFDLLTKALELFVLPEDFILVTIGNTTVSGKNNIYNLGQINDERLMSLLYSAADLFVLPSREDNLPNVMLESFACGVPILSFKTGGMAEYIHPEINGFFADAITPDSLSNAIRDFCNDKYYFSKLVIREFAEKKFSLRLQAISYINLYNKLLN